MAANTPITIQQLANAQRDATDLEHFVNDPAPGYVPTRLGGSKPNYERLVADFRTLTADMEDQFQAFLLSSGYQDLGDYAAGLQIQSRNQVFRKNDELYRASASLDLPYVTTGDWGVEVDLFVSVGDGALRQQLTNRSDPRYGSGMVPFRAGSGYPVGTAGYQLEGPVLPAPAAIQATQGTPAISYSDNDWFQYVDSMGDALYRHSPRIVRDPTGQYHLVYSRGKMHGFGGQSESDAVNPEGVACYTTSRDLVNWAPEVVIATAMPADPGLNPFRSIFDTHIGVTPSGYIAVVVGDIPPPSSQWGRYTGNTRYRLLVNKLRGDPTGWVDKGVFWEHTEDYARVYCGRIKQIPKMGGGTRMMFTDYRRVAPDAGDITIGSFFSDDEFETLPVRGADIMTRVGVTEGDTTMVDARFGITVTRPDMSMAITQDGAQTWTYIGNMSNYDRAISGEFVAPIIEAVRTRGEPRILVGWSQRTGTRSIRWMTSSVKKIFAFRDAVLAGQPNTPWTRISQSGPSFTGSAGYHSPVIFDDGTCVYADVTETTVDPSTGFMRAQLRLTRFGIESLFPHTYGLMIGSDLSALGQYNEDEIPYVPALVGVTSTGTGSITALGTNTRIGNRCRITGTLTITGLTGYAGSLRIQGLPYRSVNGMSQLVSIEVTSTLASGWDPADRVVGLIISDTNYIALYRKVAATQALVGLGATDLGANFSCNISGDYKCRFSGNQ
ncbi:hypothetical protein L537_3355 [Bordetella hinzii 1277]|uniref:hypothetical protein n=1 Tax=Bordetella hinzii TaxID=103855 RepID=UPI00045A97D1|nr:hypothetical protein [Bordetella hinzii]KCB52821.1 hypothetical protein L537_3355 [Bordetella hinzii 1277]